VKVYINNDLTAFEKIDHDLAVYQGSKNSASIFIKEALKSFPIH